MTGQTAPVRDQLVPDPVVQKELGITAMTLWRWEHDPALQFPPKIKIRERNYRSRNELEAFKTRLIANAAAQTRARDKKSNGKKQSA